MIIVIGQARTGTSLTAGILDRLGFHLGNRFLPDDDWNPRGSFVDFDFRIAHATLYAGLRLVGGHYLDDGQPMWNHWHHLIRSNLSLQAWALKDHAMLPLLNQFHAAVHERGGEVKVILTTRNLNDSVESLTARRLDHDRGKALEYQQDCASVIDKYFDRWSPTRIELDFDAAFDDPQSHVSRLAEFCEIPFDSTAVEFITPELKRFPVPNASAVEMISAVELLSVTNSRISPQQSWTCGTPGTELKTLLLSLGIRPKADGTCGCWELEQQMNEWGVEGCRVRVSEIADSLRSHSAVYNLSDRIRAAGLSLATGLAFRLNPLDPYTGLVNEAIRRSADERVPALTGNVST